MVEKHNNINTVTELNGIFVQTGNSKIVTEKREGGLRGEDMTGEMEREIGTQSAIARRLWAKVDMCSTPSKGNIKARTPEKICRQLLRYKAEPTTRLHTLQPRNYGLPEHCPKYSKLAEIS